MAPRFSLSGLFPRDDADQFMDQARLADYARSLPPPKDNWQEYKDAFWNNTATGHALTAMGNAMTLPGRVYGREPVDMTDGRGYEELGRRQQQDIEDATNLAGLAGAGAPLVSGTRHAIGAMGALAQRSFVPEAERVLASNNKTLYTTPRIAQRAFEEDYQPGALQNVADETGRIQRDLDGGPLAAPVVVGRRVLGGADETISPAELVSTIEGPTRTGYKAVPASALRKGEVGRYEKVAGLDGPEYNILVYQGLEPKYMYRALAHEIRHYFDDMAGDIPTKGLQDQFRKLYNTMNTGEVRERNLTGPQHFGYKGEDIDRELMADAIRSYMENPNYLKTKYPDVAKRIRKSLNGNPRVNKYIQFNSAAPPPLGGILGLNQDQQ